MLYLGIDQHKRQLTVNLGAEKVPCQPQNLGIMECLVALRKHFRSPTPSVLACLAGVRSPLTAVALPSPRPMLHPRNSPRASRTPAHASVEHMKHHPGRSIMVGSSHVADLPCSSHWLSAHPWRRFLACHLCQENPRVGLCREPPRPRLLPKRNSRSPGRHGSAIPLDDAK